MATFNELLQDYVNKSYDEILSLAQMSISSLSDEMNAVLGDSETVGKAYLVVTAACLGVDGRLTTLEYTFLKDLLGLGADTDYNDVKSMVESFDLNEAMSFTDNLADSLSTEGKSALLIFCIAFFAVDETISRDEVAFINKLMA